MSLIANLKTKTNKKCIVFHIFSNGTTQRSHLEFLCGISIDFSGNKITEIQSFYDYNIDILGMNDIICSTGHSSLCNLHVPYNVSKMIHLQEMGGLKWKPDFVVLSLNALFHVSNSGWMTVISIPSRKYNILAIVKDYPLSEKILQEEIAVITMMDDDMQQIMEKSFVALVHLNTPTENASLFGNIYIFLHIFTFIPSKGEHQTINTSVSNHIQLCIAVFR